MVREKLPKSRTQRILDLARQTATDETTKFSKFSTKNKVAEEPMIFSQQSEHSNLIDGNENCLGVNSAVCTRDDQPCTEESSTVDLKVMDSTNEFLSFSVTGNGVLELCNNISSLEEFNLDIVSVVDPSEISEEVTISRNINNTSTLNCSSSINELEPCSQENETSLNVELNETIMFSATSDRELEVCNNISLIEECNLDIVSVVDPSEISEKVTISRNIDDRPTSTLECSSMTKELKPCSQENESSLKVNLNESIMFSATSDAELEVCNNIFSIEECNLDIVSVVDPSKISEKVTISRNIDDTLECRSSIDELSLCNKENEASLNEEMIDDPSYIPSYTDDMDSSSSTHSDSMPHDDVIPDATETTEHQVNKSKKRAKRGDVDRRNWLYERNKLKRMQGQEYFGRRKSEDGKIVFDVKKKERKIKPPCSCSLQKKSKKYHCHKFEEETRVELFKSFWNMTWQERKVYVKQLVDKSQVKHKTVEGSRRSETLSYHMKKEIGGRLQVCKKMFLNTFVVGEWSVANWIKYSNNSSKELKVLKRSEGRRNQEISSIKLAEEFFALLPKLPSHYCRKQSTKLYLEPIWQSKALLYRQYVAYCESKGFGGNDIVSNCTFSNVFEKMNLSLFSPKKDQCDLCFAYKMGNVSENEYLSHIQLKEEARSQKEKDKTETDASVAVFTIDLQAVLLCPSLKASALYYKTKLKVHNFTAFNLKTGDGYCFLWDESQGGLNADEFSSIIFHLITNKVNTNAIKEVILYSDGCCYQNRNSILANTLLLTAVKTNLKITQKFLEKGHTQMECDSMHAAIERRIRNREIYSPAGYVEACRMARLRPKPYEVQYLTFDFFKKYSGLSYIKSIRPGSKSGDPVVTDIRCIQYVPQECIKYKLKHSEEFTNLPQRMSKKPSIHDIVEVLYKDILPIACTKFSHLQELRAVIPKEIHPFYDNLPHLCTERNCKFNCK